jgi:hypothetical protein
MKLESGKTYYVLKCSSLSSLKPLKEYRRDSGP